MNSSQAAHAHMCGRLAFQTQQHNEIDLLLYFRDTRSDSLPKESDMELLRMCDMYNIPVATNIATAEVLVCALDRGDLDWRAFVNPRSDYNRAKTIDGAI